jgi:hypothetical protein
MLSVQPFQGSLTSADPDLKAKTADIIDLYLHAPQRTAAVNQARWARHFPSCVPLHPHLLLLVESGRVVVCQDPERRHCPWRFHLARRFSPQTAEIRSRLREMG